MKSLRYIFAAILTCLFLMMLLFEHSAESKRVMKIMDCLDSMRINFQGNEIKLIETSIKGCIDPLEYEVILYQKIIDDYTKLKLTKASMNFEKVDSVPIKVQNAFNKVCGVCVLPEERAYRASKSFWINIDDTPTFTYVFWDRIKS